MSSLLETGPDHTGAEDSVIGPPSPHRVHVRGALGPVIVGLLIGLIFAVVYLAAFHAPRPHHLPVAVVGSRQVVAQVQQEVSADDALGVTAYADRQAAQEAVAKQEVFGAFISSPGGSELLVAGANGAAVTQTLQTAFAPVARDAGMTLKVTDIRPLIAGDTRGMSIFYTAFGIVLGAFLFGLSIMGMGRELPHLWRAGSAIVFSLLAGLVVAWLVGPVFGALPGPYLQIAALIAMLALAIATATAMLLRVFGSGGTFISSIVLLTLGNATSTGILPAQFLPDWLEPLTHILPVGVAVQGLRGAAYFDQAGVGDAFVVLLAWVIVSAGAFFIVHERRVRLGRSKGRPTALPAR